jgi:hypothetical protein
VVTTGRSLLELRSGAISRWTCRVYPLHSQSGRFFIEPEAAFLAQALLEDRPESWWSAAHQQGAAGFFDAMRDERVRRLGRLPERTAGGRRPDYRPLRNLGLRLESLSVTTRPDKHWRGLAGVFDEWWTTTPLHAVDPGHLGRAVMVSLSRLRAQCASWDCADARRGKEKMMASKHRSAYE